MCIVMYFKLTNSCINHIFVVKMWILMVMMMMVRPGTSKRVREEPQQLSAMLAAEGRGNPPNQKEGLLRRRKRVMRSIDATGNTFLDDKKIIVK